MSFHDRRYNDPGSGSGGLRAALRRIFADGDFYAWAIPLFRAFGIRVRIHLIFVLQIIIEMIYSIVGRDTAGPAYTAYILAALFILVLLHEFGHCFACRWVRGEADRILMWPLGGLAFCAPPHNWKASLITTFGGPGVNLILIPILGAAVLATGLGWEAVLFNPFHPWGVVIGTGMTGHVQQLAFWLYDMNLNLFLFNMLLPMYPLDCGRIVQELLWARIGYERSMSISVNLGLFLAVAVGIFAYVGGSKQLFAVAIFAGFTCFDQRRRLRFAAAEGSSVPGGYDFSRGYTSLPREQASPDTAKYKQALKQQEQERRDQAEIDRILAKIASSGMASLSGKERRTLERATEEKRKQTQ